MASLTSTSLGDVLESTAADIDSGIVPTTHLSPAHPFCGFWRDHLTDLTTPGFCDPVIDAFVAVFKGDSKWCFKAPNSTVIVNERHRIRNILHDHPPDVVVVNQHVSKGYGFHNRSPSLWPFICITRYYVDMWAAATDDVKLALGVLLDAAFKHELGHWFFTLRAGTFTQAYLDACILPQPQHQIQLATFSLPVHQSMNQKQTPKSLNTTWEVGKGEAGSWVEYQSHGGIITFNSRLNIARIQTGPNDYHPLQKSYLKARQNKSQLRFVPPVQKSKSNVSPQISDDCPFTPNDDNRGPLASTQTTPNTLGIAYTVLRTRCERHMDAHEDLQEILRQREFLSESSI